MSFHANRRTSEGAWGEVDTMSKPVAGLDLKWSSARIAVIDVERNGAQPPDLVELAIAVIDEGTVQPSRSWVVKPPHPISWQSTMIHGIRDEDVADAPAAAAIEDEVFAVLDGVDLLIGRVPVDLDILVRTFPSWSPPPALDSAQLARTQYPEPPRRTLADLVQTTYLDPPHGCTHRVRHDTTVTAHLLAGVLGARPYPVTVAELLRRASQPSSRAGRKHRDLTNF
jgi:exodeoxyribonuclease X